MSDIPPFIIFPAIDLKGGQVVRLAEGDMGRATVYGDDPAAQAMLFAQAGSDFLHVVDLDGAFAGHAVNAAAIASIVASFPGHVQIGGGIREPQAVEGWFTAGVSRVVIGTAALKNPQFVRDMAKDYPGGIVVAVDARDGFVATEGWAEKSDMPIADLARRFEDAGVASLLFTDVGRDGRSCPRDGYSGDCQRRRGRHSGHPPAQPPCAGWRGRRHHRPRAL
jgi:phosphoribosylformimino-5-aminoimidazole carboxamide ribotide isomerase